MITIAVTDRDWFNFLRSEPSPSWINFWTPTPWGMRTLRDRGVRSHFYFLVKAERGSNRQQRKIEGYAYFDHYAEMTAQEAWNEFGFGNGVSNLAELVDKVTGYATRNATTFISTVNPTIGCIVLREPVFLSPEQAFDPNAVGFPFGTAIMKYKHFNNVDHINFLNFLDQQATTTELVPFVPVTTTASERRAQTKKHRPGQTQFRRRILAVYGNRCAVSGEQCTDVLEAAHIQPYVNTKSDHIQNGIPLRLDIHRLFDAGLLTIDQHYRVVISPRLNSPSYLQYHGQIIHLPADRTSYPSTEALEIHNQVVYRG